MGGRLPPTRAATGQLGEDPRPARNPIFAPQYRNATLFLYQNIATLFLYILKPYFSTSGNPIFILFAIIMT